VYADQQQVSYINNNVDFVRLLHRAQETSELLQRRIIQSHKRVKENRIVIALCETCHFIAIVYVMSLYVCENCFHEICHDRICKGTIVITTPKTTARGGFEGKG
jgi:hypothetical protein